MTSIKKMKIFCCNFHTGSQTIAKCSGRQGKVNLVLARSWAHGDTLSRCYLSTSQGSNSAVEKPHTWFLRCENKVRFVPNFIEGQCELKRAARCIHWVMLTLHRTHPRYFSESKAALWNIVTITALPFGSKGWLCSTCQTGPHVAAEPAGSHRCHRLPQHPEMPQQSHLCQETQAIWCEMRHSGESSRASLLSQELSGLSANTSQHQLTVQLRWAFQDGKELPARQGWFGHEMLSAFSWLRHWCHSTLHFMRRQTSWRREMKE